MQITPNAMLNMHKCNDTFTEHIWINCIHQPFFWRRIEFSLDLHFARFFFLLSFCPYCQAKRKLLLLTHSISFVLKWVRIENAIIAIELIGCANRYINFTSFYLFVFLLLQNDRMQFHLVIPQKMCRMLWNVLLSLKSPLPFPQPL